MGKVEIRIIDVAHFPTRITFRILPKRSGECPSEGEGVNADFPWLIRLFLVLVQGIQPGPR